MAGASPMKIAANGGAGCRKQFPPASPPLCTTRPSGMYGNNGTREVSASVLVMGDIIHRSGPRPRPMPSALELRAQLGHFNSGSITSKRLIEQISRRIGSGTRPRARRYFVLGRPASAASPWREKDRGARFEQPRDLPRPARDLRFWYAAILDAEKKGAILTGPVMVCRSPENWNTCAMLRFCVTSWCDYRTSRNRILPRDGVTRPEIRLKKAWSLAAA